MDTYSRTVLVASGNRHKAPEIMAGLGMDGWQFLSLHSLGITDMPEETGETYEQNARIKARAARAAQLTQPAATSRPMATLADDSGLEVAALGGAPGIRSARYAGEDTTDERNTAKLLEALSGLPKDERRARFVCCIVYLDEEGRELVAKGICEGHIALGPSGEGGFGYDPVFVPSDPGDGRTMAELSSAHKDQVSHRGKALRDLREKLSAHYRLTDGWSGR
jgi:XTP/dITP diphosphohydrolase